MIDRHQDSGDRRQALSDAPFGIALDVGHATGQGIQGIRRVVHPPVRGEDDDPGAFDRLAVGVAHQQLATGRWTSDREDQKSREDRGTSHDLPPVGKGAVKERLHVISSTSRAA